jgi:hypothetical protein
MTLNCSNQAAQEEMARAGHSAPQLLYRWFVKTQDNLRFELKH